jgi:hypothetical protein
MGAEVVAAWEGGAGVPVRLDGAVVEGVPVRLVELDGVRRSASVSVSSKSSRHSFRLGLLSGRFALGLVDFQSIVFVS